MALFETSVPLTPIAPSDPRLLTPSVTLEALAFADRRRIYPATVLGATGGVRLYIYAHETFAAELLIVPFTPFVREGTVQGGLLTVWRLRAQSDTPRIDLWTTREPDSLPLERSSRSPICASAFTWRGRHTRVSIGVPDSAMMTIPGERGWFPERLEAMVDFDVPDFAVPFGPTGAGYRDGRSHEGLGIEWPPLLPGERIQAHFTVAWAEAPEIERRDYGTIDAAGMLSPTTAMAACGFS